MQEQPCCLWIIFLGGFSMPLPLIPIILGAGAGLLGIGKGIKAAVDNDDAKDVNSQANKILEEAKKHLENCREKSEKALEALGGKKLFVLNNSIPRFIAAFEKVKNVRLQDSAGIDELGKFVLDKQSFDTLRQMEDFASSFLGGVAGGAVGGALAALGAYGGVHLMATSGILTGGAIFGAAATNATLAFLGGGALAAGGLGMAGGAAVLGGLVAGPALAIMGFVMGAKASKNLDNAKSNLAEAKKIAEELNTASLLCNGIRRRSYMFERLLIRLDALFLPLIIQMEHGVLRTIRKNAAALERKHWIMWRLSKKRRAIWLQEAQNIEWSELESGVQKNFAAAASIAKAIKTVIDTPILTDDGKLTEESKKIGESVKLVVNKTESQVGGTAASVPELIAGAVLRYKQETNVK
jgi:hypothetical protein